MDRSRGRDAPSTHVRVVTPLREYRPSATRTEVLEMTYGVTLIPGDGVGPELTEATRRVLEATGVRFSWDVHQAGTVAIEASGSPLPDDVIGSIRAHGVAWKGPVSTPVGGGLRSVHVALRMRLALDAC